MEKQIADLEAYVDQSVADATSEETLSKIFATLSVINKLATDLQALTDALAKLNGDETAEGSVAKAIADAIAALDLHQLGQDLQAAQEAIEKINSDKWFSDKWDEYVKKLTFVDAAGATDAVYDAITDENNEANQKFIDAILDIVGAVEGDGFALKSDLDAIATKYDAAIEALKGRILALEGRIQSLVYVPASLDEMKTITVQGSAYIAMQDKEGNEYPFALSNSKGQIEVTFLVSPAALAKQMNKEICSLVTKQIKIEATRAAQPQFVIDTVYIKNDAQDGEFTVVASTDYDFAEGAMDNKTLAIALNVKIANENVAAEGEKPYQGIDYTSEFIGTKYVNGKKLNNRLIVARPKTATAPGDELLATGANNVLAPEGLVYTDTETVRTFFAEYDLYYQDEDMKLHAIADMGWENFPTFKRNVTDEPTVDNAANADNYDLSKAVSVQIKTSDRKLVGDAITSGTFSFTLESGDYTYTLVEQAKQDINILAEKKNVTATPGRDGNKATWTYENFSTGADYAVEYSLNPDPTKAQITKEVYDAIQALGGADIRIVLSSSAVTLASQYELSATIDFTWSWGVDVQATVTMKIPGGTLEHGDNYPESGKVEMSSVLTGVGYNTAPKSLTHIPGGEGSASVVEDCTVQLRRTRGAVRPVACRGGAGKT